MKQSPLGHEQAYSASVDGRKHLQEKLRCRLVSRVVPDAALPELLARPLARIVVPCTRRTLYGERLAELANHTHG